MRLPIAAALLLALAACGGEDAAHEGAFVRDTGGELLPEQAAYDVWRYDLWLQVHPDEQRIEGQLLVAADVVAPLEQFVLDLDPALSVSRVLSKEQQTELRYRHEAGRIWIDLGREVPPGERVNLAVDYGGKPRVAPRPPWEGGFVWSRTEDGSHWIATVCQMEGADLWWPCKDHPSDKPRMFGLHFRVPDDLVVATNGEHIRDEDHGDGTHTSHWEVNTPIANYTVAFNAAPYIELRTEYVGVSGQPFPVQFWALPESEQKARVFLSEVTKHLRWFERNFGPYPFRRDKYGVVETPHLGMEHQTIIAYGYDFKKDKWGYDWLHHHELSHEWFANLVTAPDWSDFWIHEGFGSYTQKLYIEDEHGIEAYHEALRDVRGNILNAKPVAPRAPRTSGQMYFVDRTATEGSKPTDSDIYYKGEWILHTLRWLVGEDDLLLSMRRLCYPERRLESVSDGSHCHFKTTDDYLELIEGITQRELDWFFEVYLRAAPLPELAVDRSGGTVVLEWRIDGRPAPNFPMPVEVEIGGARSRVEMPGGRTEFALPAGQTLSVDPSDWILRKGNARS